MKVLTAAKRCLSREEAATYLGVSTKQIDRLIQSRQLSEVKLPVETNRVSGRGQMGTNRRVLIDIRELDRMIDQSKSFRGF